MSNPVIFVTGANGLVGAHVVNELATAGFQNIIAQFRDIATILPNSVIGLKLDITSPAAVNTIKGYKPDVIVHCAASLPKAEDDDQAANVNKKIDATIFKAAQELNAAVIFCSSASLYYGLSIPWTEELELSPDFPYAKAKLDSEVLFSNLIKGFAALRISSPFGGTHQNRGGVLQTFIRSAISGQDIRVFGSGKRTQDFIHASDIGKVVVELIKQWDSSRGLLATGVFNVGSGRPVAMQALARIIIKKSSSTSNLMLGAEKDAQDDFRSHLDISKIKKNNEWFPATSLEQGVEELIKSFEIQK